MAIHGRHDGPVIIVTPVESRAAAASPISNSGIRCDAGEAAHQRLQAVPVTGPIRTAGNAARDGTASEPKGGTGGSLIRQHTSRLSMAVAAPPQPAMDVAA